jgi:hypothetical protein
LKPGTTKVVLVPIAALHRTQDKVDRKTVEDLKESYANTRRGDKTDKFAEPIDGDRAPDGRLVLNDGHHRIQALYEKGVKRAWVRVTNWIEPTAGS